jgi:hypothetical protein
LYSDNTLRILLLRGNILDVPRVLEILPKRKYCRREVTFATRLVALALSKSTIHVAPP